MTGLHEIEAMALLVLAGMEWRHLLVEADPVVAAVELAVAEKALVIERQNQDKRDEVMAVRFGNAVGRVMGG